MFLWQKRAKARWLAANEKQLSQLVGQRLAIIQTPDRNAASLEIAGENRVELERIRSRFGGTIERLPRDWLKRALNQRAKPIKIGKRLMILRSSASTIASARLIIPASAAFGTGEHVTTAMSLRLLEQITRELAATWSMLDLGTGSGILALAARMFRAGKVVAIDSDATAIRVAKKNALMNGICGIDFRAADARSVSGMARFTIVMANLYSKLLMEIFSKLKRCRWLILSGILREQESQVTRALKQNHLRIVTSRRRGKWIALLCCRCSRKLQEKI
jgi:ribosomal protein L11 methyltransferase